MNELTGFAFPFRIDPATGGVASSRGPAKIRDNLLMLLQTNLGERVLRRDYGSGARGLVHEPLASVAPGLLRAQIAKAVTRDEPRVRLLDLTVRSEPTTGTIELALLYEVRATQQRDQVVLSVRGLR